MQMHNRTIITTIVTGCTVLLGFAGLPAMAQIANPWEGDGAEVELVIHVEPFVQLELVTTPALLYLEIPPPGATIPSSGVIFRVSGNASATMIAEPDASVFIPFLDGGGDPEGYMGLALLNGEEIGYKLELRFPSSGISGSPTQIATLPNYEAGPTVPPLTVDLTLTNGQRNGVIHLEAHQKWTPHGGIPLPGVYVGQVILTVSADDL